MATRKLAKKVTRKTAKKAAEKVAKAGSGKAASKVTSAAAKAPATKAPKTTVKHAAKKGVKKSVKKAVKHAAGMPHDAPFERAIQDLWSAIRISPIDFIDKVTGKPFTRARFASIKSGRTIKDIEKFTKHVKKLTKSLAAFVESGGDLKTIREDVKRLGQPAPKKVGKKSAG